MRKLALAALALAVGTASSAALADGNVFVNANAGNSRYDVNNDFSGIDNHISRNGHAGALRVGYRWNSVVDYGVEAGYGFLGTATERAYYPDGSTAARVSAKTRGWLLGGNLNYNITDQWYVSARAGWFRARSLYELAAPGIAEGNTSRTGTGEYFGVGFGYKINKSFSVGVAYDTYRTPENDVYKSTRIGMYSLQGEYRF